MSPSADSTAVPEARLFLLGTIHRDPRGEELLKRMLDRIGPTIVSVETSPYAVRFRMKHARRQLQLLDERLRLLAKKRNLEIESILQLEPFRNIRNQIALPFEFSASRDYAHSRSTTVVCTDDSESSKNKLPFLEELISMPNLEAMLRLAPRHPSESFENLRKQVAVRFHGKSAPWELILMDGDTSVEWNRRTDTMERKIRRLWARTKAASGGVLVHIGGWLHLGGEGFWPNLTRRLADLSPVAGFLDAKPSEKVFFTPIHRNV